MWLLVRACETRESALLSADKELKRDIQALENPWANEERLLRAAVAESTSNEWAAGTPGAHGARSAQGQSLEGKRLRVQARDRGRASSLLELWKAETKSQTPRARAAGRVIHPKLRPTQPTSRHSKKRGYNTEKDAFLQFQRHTDKAEEVKKVKEQGEYEQQMLGKNEHQEELEVDELDDGDEAGLADVDRDELADVGREEFVEHGHTEAAEGNDVVLEPQHLKSARGVDRDEEAYFDEDADLEKVDNTKGVDNGGEADGAAANARDSQEAWSDVEGKASLDVEAQAQGRFNDDFTEEVDGAEDGGAEGVEASSLFEIGSQQSASSTRSPERVEEQSASRSRERVQGRFKSASVSSVSPFTLLVRGGGSLPKRALAGFGSLLQSAAGALASDKTEGQGAESKAVRAYDATLRRADSLRERARQIALGIQSVPESASKSMVSARAYFGARQMSRKATEAFSQGIDAVQSGVAGRFRRHTKQLRGSFEAPARVAANRAAEAAEAADSNDDPFREN